MIFHSPHHAAGTEPPEEREHPLDDLNDVANPDARCRRISFCPQGGAEIEGLDADQVIGQIVEQTPAPR